jgi:hypothetical protein
VQGIRALLVATLPACAPAGGPVELRFTADPGGPGAEQYVCFGFAADALGGDDLGAIAYLAPPGPVTLHHVSLYGVPVAFAAGPVECQAMPADAVPMNVWAPGGDDLVLADDLALVVPAGTASLVVQVHALRTADGAAQEAAVVLTPRRDAARRAGWLPLRVPVPAIRPHLREEAAATCAFDAPLTVVSTWPHMHQVGAEFHGTVVRAGGAREALVDVAPWQFEAQRAYPVDVALAAGDAIETRCVWQNDGDETILPGPGIADEMCGQSIIAWPAEAARCR